MFEGLASRFEGILRRARSRGRLGPEDVEDLLREIRLALLEADVHLDVVKVFLERIRERALGAELSGVLNPGQQVVKIVLEELTLILGGETMRFTYASKPPTVVLLAGLQGSGKTTTAAKLARWFKTRGRNPMLVGADLQRPAAVAQLETLGERIGVPVFSQPTDPIAVSEAGLAEAARLGRDVVIFDTAGRLAIDDDLMDEVGGISSAVQPDHTLLVVDSMMGQDAVNVAVAFHERLSLDAVVLTKLDGDARGGAALSVREVVGCPIAFASTGEGLEDLDVFHPDRMASRILGMGDVETLIEQVETTYDREQAEEATARMLEGRFTLDDFLDQVQQLRKMGPLSSVMKMVPGMSQQMGDVDEALDEGRVDRLEGMINSMTPAERIDPGLIDGSRRARIAAGSGTQPSDVTQLVKQFREMRKMMKKMGGKAPGGRSSNRRGKGRKSRGSGPARPPAPDKPAKPGLSLPGLGGAVEGSGTDRLGSWPID
ncbi:MAG: signal recognition particle protein [Acidimicrobiia bacterium]|nr:signal recognition particle protein [Actinomycetota bacterium]MBL6923872.1 signal recognition particle protein [Acidimicrobiia bacterium]